MKIIFVRHAHPNYTDDCLTDLGHKQAILAAERLENESIDKFYSSSCGRAYETACHIAEKHNTDVEKLDFMREISFGKQETDDFINPWSLADRWVKDGRNIMDADWQDTTEYKGRTILNCYNSVSKNFDKWIAELGYKREGDYYRVTIRNNDTVLLVSHGGSSSVVLAHIFNLPFSFVCRTICPGFTAITEVSFNGAVGELTSPQFKLVNDNNHLKALYTDNK